MKNLIQLFFISLVIFIISQDSEASGYKFYTSEVQNHLILTQRDIENFNHPKRHELITKKDEGSGYVRPDRYVAKLYINRKEKKAKLEITYDKKTYSSIYDLKYIHDRNKLLNLFDKFTMDYLPWMCRGAQGKCDELIICFDDQFGTKESQRLAKNVGSAVQRAQRKKMEAFFKEIVSKEDDYYTIDLKEVIRANDGKRYKLKFVVNRQGLIYKMVITRPDGRPVNLDTEIKKGEVIVKSKTIPPKIVFRVTEKAGRRNEMKFSVEVLKTSRPQEYHDYRLTFVQKYNVKNRRREWTLKSKTKTTGIPQLTLRQDVMDQTTGEKILRVPLDFVVAAGDATVVTAIWNSWFYSPSRKKDFILATTMAKAQDVERVKKEFGKDLKRIASRINFLNPPVFSPLSQIPDMTRKGTAIITKALFKKLVCPFLPKALPEYFDNVYRNEGYKDYAKIFKTELIQDHLKKRLKQYNYCMDEAFDFSKDDIDRKRKETACERILIGAKLPGIGIIPPHLARKDFETCEKAVNDGLSNFYECLKKADTEARQEICKYQLQRAAPYHIGRVVLDNQLKNNLNKMKDISKELKDKMSQSAQKQFRQCIERQYFVPFDEKGDMTDPALLKKYVLKKKKLGNLENLEQKIIGCVYSSILAGVDRGISPMIMSKLNEHVKLTKEEKANRGDYAKSYIEAVRRSIKNQMLRFADDCFDKKDLYRRKYNVIDYNYKKLAGMDARLFERKLVACKDEITMETGARVARRAIRTDPRIKVIEDSLNFNNTVEEILNTGYWPCVRKQNFGKKNPQLCEKHVKNVARAIVTREAIYKKIEEQILEVTGNKNDLYKQIFTDKIKPQMKACFKNIERDKLFDFKSQKTNFEEVAKAQVKCLKKIVEEVAFQTAGIILKQKIKKNKNLEKFKIKLSNELIEEVNTLARDCFRDSLNKIEDDIYYVQDSLKDIKNECTLALYKMVIPRIVGPILEKKVASHIKVKKVRKKRIKILKQALVAQVNAGSTPEEIMKVVMGFESNATYMTLPTVIGLKIDKLISPKGKLAEYNKCIKKIIIKDIFDIYKEKLDAAYKAKDDDEVENIMIQLKKFVASNIAKKISLIETKKFFRSTSKKKREVIDKNIWKTGTDEKIIKYCKDKLSPINEKHDQLADNARIDILNCLNAKPSILNDEQLEKRIDMCAVKVKVDTTYRVMKYLLEENLKKELPGKENEKVRKKIMEGLLTSKDQKKKIKAEIRKVKSKKGMLKFADNFKLTAARKIAPYVIEAKLADQFKNKDDQAFKNNLKKKALDDLNTCLKKVRRKISRHYAKISKKNQFPPEYPTEQELNKCVFQVKKDTTLNALHYVASKQMGLISSYTIARNTILMQLKKDFNKCMEFSKDMDACISSTVLNFSKRLGHQTLNYLQEGMITSKEYVTEAKSYHQCLLDIISDIINILKAKALKIKEENKNGYDELNKTVKALEETKKTPYVYMYFDSVTIVKAFTASEQLNTKWLRKKIKTCANGLKSNVIKYAKAMVLKGIIPDSKEQKAMTKLFDTLVPLMDLNFVSKKNKTQAGQQESDPIKTIVNIIKFAKTIFKNANYYDLWRGRGSKLDRQIDQAKIKLYAFITAEDEKKIEYLIKNNQKDELQKLLKEAAGKKVEVDKLISMLLKTDLANTIIKSQVSSMLKKLLKQFYEKKNIKGSFYVSILNKITGPKMLDKILDSKKGNKALDQLVKLHLLPILSGKKKMSEVDKVPPAVMGTLAEALTQDLGPRGPVASALGVFVQQKLNDETFRLAWYERIGAATLKRYKERYFFWNNLRYTKAAKVAIKRFANGMKKILAKPGDEEAQAKIMDDMIVKIKKDVEAAVAEMVKKDRFLDRMRRFKKGAEMNYETGFETPSLDYLDTDNLDLLEGVDDKKHKKSNE